MYVKGGWGGGGGEKVWLAKNKIIILLGEL